MDSFIDDQAPVQSSTEQIIDDTAEHREIPLETHLESHPSSLPPPPAERPRFEPRRPNNAPLPTPSNVLGVFGLSIRTGERDLEDEFSRMGKVDKVVIVYDQRSDRSRGFGFVTMSTIEEAEKCISDLNGMELHGRRLRVDFSATVRPHSSTPGEYRGIKRDDYSDSRGGNYGGGRAGYGGGGGGGGRGGYNSNPNYNYANRGPAGDKWAQSAPGSTRDRDRDGGRGYGASYGSSGREFPSSRRDRDERDGGGERRERRERDVYMPSGGASREERERSPRREREDRSERDRSRSPARREHRSERVSYGDERVEGPGVQAARGEEAVEA